MSTLTFITICIGIVLTIYCSILYIRDLKKGDDSFFKKTVRWIKNVIDVLFGIG